MRVILQVDNFSLLNILISNSWGAAAGLASAVAEPATHTLDIRALPQVKTRSKGTAAARFHSSSMMSEPMTSHDLQLLTVKK